MNPDGSVREPVPSDAPPTLREIPWDSVRAVLEGSRATLFLQLDPDGRVVGWNARAAEVFGVASAGGRGASDLVVAHAVAPLLGWARGGPLPSSDTLDFVDRAQTPFTMRCHLLRDGGLLHVFAEPSAPDDARLNRALLPMVEELALLHRESVRTARELAEARAEIDRAHVELKTTYWHLKKVRELISICMTCGRIQTDEASWTELSEYLVENGIFASHGLCPACADAFEKNLDELTGLDGASA